MPFSKGDFVLVEYSIRIKDTNTLVDTTSEEEAKKEGVYEEGRYYGPQLVIIGEGRLIKGLEEAIEQMNVGEEKTVEIPPEKAYGERDPSKVKVYSVKQFLRHGVVPEPGKIVEINGKMARIVSVTGGRVTVDFNHPLAGRTLVARVKVIAKLEKDEDKVKYLAARRLRTKPENISVEVDRDKGLVRIRLSRDAALRADVAAKIGVLSDINRYLDWVRKVEFVEEYELPSRQESSQQKEE